MIRMVRPPDGPNGRSVQGPDPTMLLAQSPDWAFFLDSVGLAPWAGLFLYAIKRYDI